MPKTTKKSWFDGANLVEMPDRASQASYALAKARSAKSVELIAREPGHVSRTKLVGLIAISAVSGVLGLIVLGMLLTNPVGTNGIDPIILSWGQ